jgi:uncharacterized protein YbjT (DUF2867 family)
MLRPAPFARNCQNWWGTQIQNGDVVRWFCAAAQTAPVDERDIAAVAVRTLCEDGHHGRDYVLTGSHSLTQRDQLTIIGDVIGRTLRFEEVSPETARTETLVRWPPLIADMLLSAYSAAVDRPALVTSTITDVTGRAARTFREWVVDHAHCFVRSEGG